MSVPSSPPSSTATTLSDDGKELPPGARLTEAVCPFIAGPGGVFNGNCWYDFQWLERERDAIHNALQELGDQEYDEWVRLYDQSQDNQERVVLRGLSSSNIDFLPIPGADPFQYVKRCQDHILWRSHIRSFTKAQKRQDIDRKVIECLRWWCGSRQGGPQGARRIEMGLCGLNLFDGKGNGLGGGH